MNSLDLFNKYIEYDHIIDLWYSWLYSRLHFLLSKEVIQKFSPKNVLDIGCGTGFQSFLHYIDGSRVIGIDSSVKMIKIAQRKMGSLNQSNRLMLFPGVAIMSASVGMLGGARAQYHLRQIFVYLNMYPINGPEVIVTFAQDKFDANGNLVDENTQMFVRQLLQNLVNWTKKLKQ